MSKTTATSGAKIRVALLGNPNTGKSTLFTALVGTAQRVGNYPGVTVEKKVGQTQYAGRQVTVIDLPGTYSLAPRALDETVTVDVLLGRRRDAETPDVIVCIVDASNLERNLYLVSQALELDRPLVVALNKVDIVEERGDHIDLARLRQRLGVPVIEMQAHRRLGVEDLKRAVIEAVNAPPPATPSPLPPVFRDEVAVLKSTWGNQQNRKIPRYLAERLLLDTGGYLEHPDFGGSDPHLVAAVHAARRRLAEKGCVVPAVETMARYQWVDQILQGVVERGAGERTTVTDLIDRVATHRVAGGMIFALLMIIVFQAIFSWAVPFQELIEKGTGAFGAWITTLMPAGVLQSLLADGVVAGVGAVLTFLPQIAMLFFFVAILEECGYMSRAAYLMDGMMSRVGLSGKSCIPLLSSFACAVPGVMATRVIEDRRDRLLTILVAPLMSCSARLPVYTLLIAAFIPNRRFLGGWLGLQGITIVALYGLGIVVAICAAKILKIVCFKGETPPFVIELPDYRLPSVKTVVRRVGEQSWSFIRGAGTLILAVTVIVWAAAYFPRPEDLETQIQARFADEVARIESQLQLARSNPAPTWTDHQRRERIRELKEERKELEATISNQVSGAYMEQSVLGHLGKLVAPVVRPLGWDWRIGCAVVASFPAREVVISAMGVIYNLGDNESEDSESLKQKLAAQTWPGTNRPIFTVPVALSIMVFFALCAQCAATLIVIQKEAGSWKWAAFAFTYMTCLAYVGALLTYQIGTWLSG
ncbi:MAG: ferrous iron transport protein B [Planctomycetota bacterium]